MIEIRIHGRGGQGAVTAAEILASAAFLDGKEAQAFPNFGVERTGAPVQAYCRVDSQRIRIHQQVYEPNLVVVLDETLVETANVFSGIQPGGTVLIASKKHPSQFPSPQGIKVITVDAYAIAKDKIGRPIVNTAVLGALSHATSIASIGSLKKAVEEHFPGPIAEKNVAALQACFDAVELN